MTIEMKMRKMKKNILAVAFLMMIFCWGQRAEAKIICVNCGGTGSARCSTCYGDGIVNDRTRFQRICYSCHGSGKSRCRACNGKGYLGSDDSGLSGGGSYGDSSGGNSGSNSEGYSGSYDLRSESQKQKTYTSGTVTAKGNRVVRATGGVSVLEESLNLFDGNTETKWCLGGTSAYVIWKAPKLICVGSYKMVTGNDCSRYPGRNPKTWVLYGSKKSLKRNSKKWNVIHRVTNDKKLRDEDFLTQVYQMKNASQKYRYFKLEIKSNKGTEKCIQLSEFTLIEKQPPKLDKTSLTLTAGNTAVLKVKGTNKKVKWKSSKASVATVDKKGKVRAKKAGKCKITAKVENRTLRCSVTVQSKVKKKSSGSTTGGKTGSSQGSGTGNNSTKITGIELSETKILGIVGYKTSLKASVLPNQAAGSYTLEWSSSNTGVVSVNQQGVLGFLKEGKAEITVKVRGTNISAKCAVSSFTPLSYLKLCIIAYSKSDSEDGYYFYSDGSVEFLYGLKDDSIMFHHKSSTSSYFGVDEVYMLMLGNENNAYVKVQSSGGSSVTGAWQSHTLIPIASYSKSSSYLWTTDKGNPDGLQDLTLRIAMYDFDTAVKNLTKHLGLREIGFKSW